MINLAVKGHEARDKDVIKIDIPKGYEFYGVDDDNQQVVFEKISYHYPKTYDECCDVLELDDDERYINVNITNIETLENKKFEAFISLIRCRNAYWKIAGEQMGSGKPWNPSKNDTVCNIFRLEGKIVKDDFVFGDSLILEFPTEEMRDTFLENFGHLIELCKELL